MKNAYRETATAQRYDSARNLPAETIDVWLEALTSAVPKREINRALDLGCGTGRFTAALTEAFDCEVVGVEPSEAMLDVARARSEAESDSRIEWRQGAAEDIPLEDQMVDLVFMSQVFHHLSNPPQALNEINRVLTPDGYLAIRSGMCEENDQLAWLRFFPEARELEDKRTPSRKELKDQVGKQSFALIAERTIQQLFAFSYDEYFQKISRRGLSSLIALDDESFQTGLESLREWVSRQPPDMPVYEPVDLFVFQKLQTKT